MNFLNNPHRQNNYNNKAYNFIKNHGRLEQEIELFSKDKQSLIAYSKYVLTEIQILLRFIYVKQMCLFFMIIASFNFIVLIEKIQ